MLTKTRIVLLLSAFVLLFASTASASGYQEAERAIEDMLNEGFTIEVIAKDMFDNDSLKFRGYGPNMLKLVIAVCELELELLNETAKEVVAPAGVYTVGIDIPAGDYSLSFANNAAFHFAIVKVYDESGKKVVMHTMSNNNIRVGKLALEKGQTVEITSESIKFTPYEGLGF